jgi:hypothetical protein
MVRGRTFKRIGLLVTILLLTVTFISFAESLENKFSLKDYMSKGFDGNDLEQRNTLLRFQAENNLLVDGVIGELTEEALIKENKHIIDIIPQEAKDKEWFIVVNKTKKILTVYHEGEVYKKYPVALGKSSTPTPDYKFTIINKIKNPYWGGMGGKFKSVKGGAPNNPLGKRWLGLSTDKYKGYGIHGNSQPFSIGKYISAGCIRMINEDIDELFEYIPINTEVWIGSEEVLEKCGIKQYIEYEKIEEMCRLLWQNRGWQVMEPCHRLFFGSTAKGYVIPQNMAIIPRTKNTMKLAFFAHIGLKILIFFCIKFYYF